MAGQRKLMSEIDRTLKKVSEGVDVFNEIWDKVYSATAQNQKEKHEADLKKEIKKLQRFRDQIKNWIGNSDVKDKRQLLDARKLIEQKMEEFKVCEKETKTKAYSKEGLAQVERLDPAEQAKQNTRNWIQDCLTSFNEQIEAFECDLERLHTSTKGKNKNKQEVSNLEALMSRHKWHVLKLEQIIRLLDNDALEASVIDELKEDIEYYLEANQEPDFMDTYGDDDIYENLDLDSLGAAMQVILPTEQDIGLDDSSSYDAGNSNDKSSSASSSSRSSSKTPKKTSSVITGIGRAGAVKPIELKTSTSVLATPSRGTSSSASSASSAATGSASKNASGATADDSTDSSKPEEKPKSRATPQRQKVSPRPVVPSEEQAMSAPSSSHGSNDTKHADTSAKQTHPPTDLKNIVTKNASSAAAAVASSTPITAASVVATSVALTESNASVKVTITGAAHNNNQAASSTPSGPSKPAVSPAATKPPVSGASSGLAIGVTTPSSSSSSSSFVSPQATLIPPPASPQLTEEQKQILSLVDESFRLIPESRDSEKENRYVPRNAYPTHASFPTSPIGLFESPKVFEKLDIDTLFFIFYYQQGSYQQYLAAKELKRRTWGYHKKYKTWFKRHEEPQVTGDDYEQGTFVYFDYETGWCQRIKTEFTFEYSYLEDELV